MGIGVYRKILFGDIQGFLWYFNKIGFCIVGKVGFGFFEP